MSYADFVTQAVNGQNVPISLDELLRIYLSGFMPDETPAGCSTFRSVDLDESEEQVKATAGVLYGGIVINVAAAVRYLKFYNAPAASVTVGTTTPVMTIPIPVDSSNLGNGFILPIPPLGVAFDTGISVAATTGVADDDTGAPDANDIVVNFWYK